MPPLDVLHSPTSPRVSQRTGSVFFSVIAMVDCQTARTASVAQLCRASRSVSLSDRRLLLNKSRRLRAEEQKNPAHPGTALASVLAHAVQNFWGVWAGWAMATWAGWGQQRTVQSPKVSQQTLLLLPILLQQMLQMLLLLGSRMSRVAQVST